MFETELLSYLKADSDLSDLIDNRIYTESAPQQPTYPFVVYSDVSEVAEYVYEGSRSGLYERHFQFDCYSQTRGECRQIRDALHAALSNENIRGEWGGSPPSIKVLGSFLMMSEGIDRYESDPKVARITIQYKFLFNLL